MVEKVFDISALPQAKRAVKEIWRRKRTGVRMGWGREGEGGRE